MTIATTGRPSTGPGLLAALSFALTMALATSAAPGQTAPSPSQPKEEPAVDGDASKPDQETSKDTDKPKKKQLKVAVFGAGCFWCVEAVFQRLDGVERVVSGYSGGTVPNPTYKEVCTGLTGHAEVAQITYDPDVISYKELLEVFWKTHDPTTLNRQGMDVGTQYRSAIFYTDDEQRDLAQTYKKKLNEAKVFRKPVVTKIEPLTEFYPAENYHQNYFNNNAAAPYCQMVIVPKLQKFYKVFGEKAKQ